jgi:two-component sensor histidine kinase
MTTIDLSKALPGEAYAPKPGLFAPYGSYPVFGLPWLKRRTFWWSFWVLVLSILIFGLTQTYDTLKSGESLTLSMLVFVKLWLLSCPAPIFATLARYRFFGHRHETYIVFAALVLGVAVGVGAVFTLVDKPRAALAATLIARESTQKFSPEIKQAAQMKSPEKVDLLPNFLTSLLFGGGFAFLAYMRERRRLGDLVNAGEVRRLKEQKQIADTRLTVLQAQVEPHFLFNSLASVRALVKQDPDRAQLTIDALVEYLRATIPQIRADQGVMSSTLKQQFDMCTAYLDVMAVRMGGRLQTEVALPIELERAEFPPLILITLVENAVKHGAEPKPGQVNIDIRAARALDGRLQVIVEDTGAGLSPNANSGVGLANIREQLMTRFGSAASLDLTQRSDAHGGGVRAVITIPFIESSVEKAQQALSGSPTHQKF